MESPGLQFHMIDTTSVYYQQCKFDMGQMCRLLPNPPVHTALAGFMVSCQLSASRNRTGSTRSGMNFVDTKFVQQSFVEKSEISHLN